MSDLSVAVCQLTSVDSVSENLNQILDRLAALESDPPDLVSFPENALYLRLREGETIPAMALDDPALLKLAEWAKKFKSVLHIGSVALARDGGVYNSTLFITSDGRIENPYQKIHLFDVNVEGHKPVRESDAFSAGARPALFEIKGWKFGCTICYDLRFAELFLTYAKLEVDALLIPSAFLVPTGQAHWHVLTRARAIESQAYVLAAAQGGVHKNAKGDTRKTFGHSIAIDPWGVVLDECLDEGPQILRITLKRDRIRQVRAQIPMKNHRRLI